MSFWLDGAPFQDYGATAELPARAQAVVVGGGLTGLSAAYWLRRNGIEVTLLEARGLSGGATGRNGGHIVSGPAVEFAEAVRRYGPEAALAIYRFTLQTIDAIQSFVAEHQLECDLALNGTAFLALEETGLRALADSAGLMTKHGLPVVWWDAVDCACHTHSDSFLGGFLNPAAGQLWPARLAFGIAEQALRLGVQIRTQTPVQGVERRGGCLQVSAGLREFLPRHFPALRGLGTQQEWTGIIASSPDLNPLIGPLPDRPGEHIAAGYSGHGLPIAFSAGKAAAEMLAGRTPELFVDAFRAERFR